MTYLWNLIQFPKVLSSDVSRKFHRIIFSSEFFNQRTKRDQFINNFIVIPNLHAFNFLNGSFWFGSNCICIGSIDLIVLIMVFVQMNMLVNSLMPDKSCIFYRWFILLGLGLGLGLGIGIGPGLGFHWIFNRWLMLLFYIWWIWILPLFEMRKLGSTPILISIISIM